MRCVRIAILSSGCVFLAGFAHAQSLQPSEPSAVPTIAAAPALVSPSTAYPSAPVSLAPTAPTTTYAVPYAPAVATPVGPAGSHSPVYLAPVAPPTAYGLVQRFQSNAWDPYGPCDSVEGLIARWKATKESDRAKVEASLRQELNKEFQDRMAVEEQRVKMAEAEAKKLRERLELRRQKQDDIVDFRLQQLLREAQGIGWEHDFPSPLPPMSWYAPDEAAPMTVSCVVHPLPGTPPVVSAPPTMRK